MQKIIQFIYTSLTTDLLEIRLNELENIVDVFVIIEYPFDYSLNQRPMYFNESKHLEKFSKHQDKIIHVIDDGTYGGQTGLFLQSQRQQSQLLMDVVKTFDDDDFITICDDDAYIKKETFDDLDITKHTVFRMEWCQYWINAYCPHVGFDWCFGATVKFFKQVGSIYNMIRTMSPDRQLIENSGWHWAKLGGVEKIIESITGYPHAEYKDNKKLLDPVLIQKRIDSMQGWDDGSENGNPVGWKYEYRKFDPEYYPKYIGDNLDIYSKYIKQID